MNTIIETDGASAFLSALWGANPDDTLSGKNYITELTEKGMKHHPVASVTEAVSRAMAISNASGNAYHACAEYITTDNRKAENVRQAHAFWFDIDCGEAKAATGDGYTTKGAATKAVAEFCKATGIPTPNALVDSGNGLHIYWLMDISVGADEWTALAMKLKALTAKHGLLADPSRTSDRASVLRVPGTMNMKDPANPKPVTLKLMTGAVSFAIFKAAIEAADAGDDAKPSLNDALRGGMDKNLHRPLPETLENIAEVRRMLGFIPASCNRAQYLRIMWSVLATGWSVAEELAREWAITDPKYDPVEFNKNVLSFNPDLKDGVGFGTLWHWARQGGWVEAAITETDPIKLALREFNTRYFVARVGGGVFVFDEQDGNILAGGMSTAAFKQYYAGREVSGVNIAGKWVKWEDRRTYSALIFDPSNKTTPGMYNTWRGLVMQPKLGECGRILTHIKDVWCSNNSAQFEYVVRWLALLMQRPWYKPEVALVLRSKEGTGKTIIVQILLDILGTHGFTAAQKEQVAGRFNGHLFDKVLVVLEEAFFAGDPAAVAATKALVTNKTLGYEAKGKDSFNAANYAHVISLTNHSWAVPAGEDSRRWMVLDVDDSKRGNHAYFTGLSAEIDNGGKGAFLHYLLSVDLTGWNPRAFPDSKALHTQQVETLSRSNPVAAWWLNVLAGGSFTVEGGAIDWRTEIPAADLQESYLRASARMRNAPSWDAAAKQLRKLIPPGALGRIRRCGQDGRLFFYSLPELDEARAYFRTITGVDPCEA